MNEQFLYQQSFQRTITPERDRSFLDITHSLFDAAHNLIEWDNELFLHLNKVADSKQASQVFFEHENTEEQYYDRMVLSAMPQHVSIGLEHRDFARGNNGYHSSLSVYGGKTTVYFNDVANVRVDNGSSERQPIEDFKNRFYAVAAAMGLFNHIKRLDTQADDSNTAMLTQIERSDAIFANAA